MASLIEVTKSNAGFFSGLYKSKKFALAAVWTTAALAYPEAIPAWVGAIVAAAYVLGQSIVEAVAARAAGKIADDDSLDLRTKADFEKKP